MVAILHSIIANIEYNRIKDKLFIWQYKKDLNKAYNIILNQIKFFSKVSLFKNHLDKINNKDYAWGRNWD